MSLADLKGTLVLDPTHTTLSFVTRHAMVTKVRGSFEKFEGSAVVDAANPAASSLDVKIETASVDTRNADRDAHLRSGDFFDAEQFPYITFKGTDFAVKGDVVEVTGDMTIKDVTRSVTFPLEYQGEAKDPFGNTRVGFEGSVQVLRSDFGLTWNAALETGGFLVSDKVTLELEISAIAQA
ncbi:YceI family protein [Tessaracoccus lacteus]|uniref:YceI family protein n=1 Tax=Tessaracoccus lacteus TaxID=3041766 RepID=A0ABY8PWT7_9ACTN|nr:YceI family protein [Tessaracoccus sp. T21]WGT46856.1 YceI family protein [Tessaracoccus sp. T21]